MDAAHGQRLPHHCCQQRTQTCGGGVISLISPPSLQGINVRESSMPSNSALLHPTHAIILTSGTALAESKTCVVHDGGTRPSAASCHAHNGTQYTASPTCGTHGAENKTSHHLTKSRPNHPKLEHSCHSRLVHCMIPLHPDGGDNREEKRKTPSDRP